MKRIAALLIAGLLGISPAWAASLLPNGEQTFVDQNGQPLSGGTACFYIPNTLTPKLTWQDSAQTIPNTSPCVSLNAAGRAIIYGSGTYRQRILDVYGNLQWDQLTFGTGGVGGIYQPCLVTILTSCQIASQVLSSNFNYYIIDLGSPAAETFKLPLLPTLGDSYLIKDGSGTAATDTITIDGNGQTIDGGSQASLVVNFQELGFIWNGIQWNIF